jgi:hypothetical protein
MKQAVTIWEQDGGARLQVDRLALGVSGAALDIQRTGSDSRRAEHRNRWQEGMKSGLEADTPDRLNPPDNVGTYPCNVAH